MRITGRSSTGYHPNARVKSSHTSSMSGMGWNERRTTLFTLGTRTHIPSGHIVNTLGCTFQIQSECAMGDFLITYIGYILGAIEWEHVGHMPGQILNVTDHVTAGQIVATVVVQILNKFGTHILATLVGKFDCDQNVPTGCIGATCCLCSQCVHNVSTGYIGPCPQCQPKGVPSRHR